MTKQFTCFYDLNTKVKVVDMTWWKHQKVNNEYDYGSIGEIVYQFQPDGSFLGYKEPYYYVVFDPNHTHPAIITESCLEPVDVEPLYEIPDYIIDKNGDNVKAIRPIGTYQGEKIYLVDDDGVRHVAVGTT